MMETYSTDESIEEVNDKRSVTLRRSSVLPLRWRITHSPRWIAQVAASELSLVALVVLLVTVFSTTWLHVPGSRFYQHHPVHVMDNIHTTIHFLSMGPLYICRGRSCLKSQDRKGISKMWIDQPMFGVTKISCGLALEFGLILTIWLHLSYLPKLKKLHSFCLIGIILSFCEATFTFFTLLLFAVNLWTFELKKNISVPLGWSYLIGWLAFLLYVTCAQ
ncbi:outer dense fiber protein 4 [Octodon degus]|uniref:Outer dense fiber protein 4 n=1 Tax=Octodon degus TaxID=10160 RepID=A0A6P6F446_OCTDE|nr:outer dense fiber protein 4 [Octodon degus]